jgi:hypothetical protein
MALFARPPAIRPGLSVGNRRLVAAVDAVAEGEGLAHGVPLPVASRHFR